MVKFTNDVSKVRFEDLPDLHGFLDDMGDLGIKTLDNSGDINSYFWRCQGDISASKFLMDDYALVTPVLINVVVTPVKLGEAKPTQ